MNNSTTAEMVAMARRLTEARSLELGRPLNDAEIRDLLSDYEGAYEAWRRAGHLNAASNLMMWDEPDVACIDGTERHDRVVSAARQVMTRLIVILVTLFLVAIPAKADVILWPRPVPGWTVIEVYGEIQLGDLDTFLRYTENVDPAATMVIVTGPGGNPTSSA
jgi:hypothetical protein